MDRLVFEEKRSTCTREKEGGVKKAPFRAGEGLKIQSRVERGARARSGS